MSLDDSYVREVFNITVQRVVKGLVYNGWVKAVAVWHKHQKSNITRETAKKIHLVASHVAQGERGGLAGYTLGCWVVVVRVLGFE